MPNLKKKKIEKYLDKMILIYQNIYKIGLETNGELANPDQYLGKIQALKEFRVFLNKGEFFDSDWQTHKNMV